MSAWLTHLVIDTRDRRVVSEVSDAVRLHKRIMTLVPDDLGENARQKAAVLYRIDETQHGSTILVQTSLKPDIHTLPDGYRDRRVSDLTPLMTALTTGIPIRYRIAANAVRRLGRFTTAGRPGQVLPLHGNDAAEWWSSRAQAAGLLLKTLECMSEDPMSGKRTEGDRIRHAVTRYDGYATVINPEALRAAITTGVGRGKSYGCGLLSVAPARQPA